MIPAHRHALAALMVPFLQQRRYSDDAQQPGRDGDGRDATLELAAHKTMLSPESLTERLLSRSHLVARALNVGLGDAELLLLATKWNAHEVLR